ncbi:DUF819 family protein [Mobilicoccus pelagius]|uniref:DUF819 domain-containing protein n=1 Tax=Mobilicoccus pelagius NBRC 104925 TaxID=1089455 RepID=H5UU60_9MICO|nr:DUF819 family protein [Mobilicoccus pelagius]GAB49268.1 hypothetical protein MOPEL_099_00680 [Mobilicoccus pelagius NBRC 104925]
MITDGVLMLGVLLGLAGVIVVLERTTGWWFFRYVPGMVLMYLLCAALNSMGLFGHADETRDVVASVKNVVLPAMIFLFLLGCDLRRIVRLGPKLLLTMFVTSVSLFVAMIAVFAVFRGLLDPEAWKVLGALLASWTGGSANMVAVQDILQAPKAIFGYALITDTIVYSFWLMVMFSSVAFSDRFNRFTGADTSYLAVHGGDAEAVEEGPITRQSLAVAVFGSIFVSTVSIAIGGMLPKLGDVVNATAWTILIVSLLGLLAAHTPLGRVAGSSDVASLMLFVVIGQIASGSDFSAITKAPLYLLVGFLVLLVHAVLMVIYAKLTHTELFSLAVASVANVGGIASAPVVAGAFDRQLVPVGVLFALIGSFMGTWIGLTGAAVMGAM